MCKFAHFSKIGKGILPFLLLTYDDVIAGDTKAWRDDSILVQLVVDGIAHALTRLPAPCNNYRVEHTTNMYLLYRDN
jgi:hypothetical protein